MFKDRLLPNEILKEFDFEKTKNNVFNYFVEIQQLEWDIYSLYGQMNLTACYDFSAERTPYMLIGKDEFDLSLKGDKEQELEMYMTGYCCAKSRLIDIEQIYIDERFVNRKNEGELVGLVGCSSSDGNDFRKIKKSAIYKFADCLGLLVKNDDENKEKVLMKKLGGKR